MKTQAFGIAKVDYEVKLKKMVTNKVKLPSNLLFNRFHSGRTKPEAFGPFFMAKIFSNNRDVFFQATYWPAYCKYRNVR